MTIFERIIAGELSCHRLHEDDFTFAFLDNGPIVEGHALLIPKTPAATLDELSPEAGAQLGAVLPRLARALKDATGCDGLNLLLNSGEVAGQEVPHLHFHLIPRRAGDGDDGGPMRRWNPGSLDHEDATILATKVREAMGRWSPSGLTRRVSLVGRSASLQASAKAKADTACQHLRPIAGGGGGGEARRRRRPGGIDPGEQPLERTLPAGECRLDLRDQPRVVPARQRLEPVRRVRLAEHARQLSVGLRQQIHHGGIDRERVARDHEQPAGAGLGLPVTQPREQARERAGAGVLGRVDDGGEAPGVEGPRRTGHGEDAGTRGP